MEKSATKVVIEVVKDQDGVMQVKWANEMHFKHSIISFKMEDFFVSCTHKLLENEVRQGNRVTIFPFNLEICLEQLSKDEDNKEIPNRHSHLLRSVWASVNGGQKKQLKESRVNANKWTLDNIYAEVIVQGMEWKPSTLNVFLWIHFKPLSFGEINTLKHLRDILAYQRNCDVKFTFKGDGSSRHIGGHTLILAAKSQVFAAMFQHEMQESLTGQVEIEDIKRNIFKELLHYIYSGQTSTPLTEETAQSLYVAADKYDVGDLKGECLQFLLSIIRKDNAVSLMAWADLHSVENLKEAALHFASQHGKEICQSKEFEQLMKNFPDLCLLATQRMMK